MPNHSCDLFVIGAGSGGVRAARMAAQRGARVARSAAVGTVGVSSTGATGLYFELRVDGRPVDPVQWLRKK